MQTFLKAIFATIILSFGFTSCSNELPINAEWKDIAYVYGLLDAGQDTQFVRIGKAFLGDGPPSDFAQVSDSIYYDEIIVRLLEVNNGNVTKTIPLERIEKPGLMEEGFFTTADYRLYYTRENLNVDRVYRIEVEKPDGGPTVVAETAITNWTLNQNTGNVVEPFTNLLPFINNFNRPVQFVWNEANNAAVYEGKITLYYREQSKSNRSDIKNKTMEYFFRSGRSPGSTSSSISAEQFFGFVSSNLEVNPNVFRYFDRIILEVYAGGEDLASYASINGVSTGIAQERPTFTNIENGVGVFSSKARTFALTNGQLKEFSLNAQSFKELVMGLCDYNFVRTQFTDSCYCDGGVIQRIGSTTGNCNLD
ncbi:MAG: DUF4249 family protein [Cryomorphaceae bacterium]|nr:DUF4249 family protein [Cryomorphaceae bacterium]